MQHVHLFGHRVDVPPLRMRLDDIVDLAPVLLAELADDGRRPALRPAALTALLRHDWPGDVRELRAALSVALAAAGTDPIALFHLPATYQEADRGRRWSTIELAERDAILRALETHDGNKRAAARTSAWPAPPCTASSVRSTSTTRADRRVSETDTDGRQAAITMADMTPVTIQETLACPV